MPRLGANVFLPTALFVLLLLVSGGGGSWWMLMSATSGQGLLVVAADSSSSNIGGGGGGGMLSQPDRWALLVSTSRFWHNYRHAANALSLYHILKDRRIPDSNIILMLGDHYACDPRNINPGTMYNNRNHHVNLHRCDIQIDYTGYQVSVKATLEVLMGLYDPVATPHSRRMQSGPNSNVVWYMTGHGGEGFLKYHDTETITDEDIGQVVSLMHAQQRYGKLLLIFETCQASALCGRIDAPNVVCIAASMVGEDSYSHHADPELGVHVIDRFTYETLEFFKSIPPHRRRDVTLWEMVTSYSRDRLLSSVFWSANRTVLEEWKVSDFFDSAATESAHPGGIVRHDIESLFP